MTTTEKVPPPIPLCAPGETEPLAYACAVCFHSWGTPETAAFCHSCTRCGGKREVHFGTVCEACRPAYSAEQHVAWKADQAKKEAERFVAAAQVADHEGAVYWEGHLGSFGEDYFRDVDEVRDYCADHDIPLPAYVWATTEIQLSLDADDIIEHALESGEHHEDADDNIGTDDRRKLQGLLDAWCAEQAVVSYMVDYTRAVFMTEETP